MFKATSATTVVSDLPAPPTHIDLSFGLPRRTEFSTTRQEFLRLPLVPYICRTGVGLANRLRILHSLVPDRSRTSLLLRKVHHASDVAYHVFMECEEPIKPMFLVAARKRISHGITYYDFWADDSVINMRRNHPSSVGYVRSNAFGTAFTTFINPPESVGNNQLYREVAAAIRQK